MKLSWATFWSSSPQPTCTIPASPLGIVGPLHARSDPSQTRAPSLSNLWPRCIRCRLLGGWSSWVHTFLPGIPRSSSIHQNHHVLPSNLLSAPTSQRLLQGLPGSLLPEPPAYSLEEQKEEIFDRGCRRQPLARIQPQAARDWFFFIVCPWKPLTGSWPKCKVTCH